jgi:hypothetical protein
MSRTVAYNYWQKRFAHVRQPQGTQTSLLYETVGRLEVLFKESTIH